MDTPVYDFVQTYRASGTVRLHMPGHKGKSFLGCESADITEIDGADALYEAQGIIARSEANAARLFGAARTLYSTEGSSQCIRAMVYLAVTNSRQTARPYILAARNVHKAFLYALALCDVDVRWLWPEAGRGSLCSCPITAAQVEAALGAADYLPAAVYITSPDYLGFENPIAEIAAVCHRHNVPLLVDNAHGAYLRFLPQSRHPLDLGADMCCDSAHKTLPVLTGGAYLHIAECAPEYMRAQAKQAMALFGSTSPSYLTLASLDLCNAYLAGDYAARLAHTVKAVAETKRRLEENGWTLQPGEPLKITLRATRAETGAALAARLRAAGIECEYADADFLVLMPSAETTERELSALIAALGENTAPPAAPAPLPAPGAEREMTVRAALFAPQETVRAENSIGRICAAPTVGCPPAIPIAITGELIDESAAALFRRYGIEQVSVVKE